MKILKHGKYKELFTAKTFRCYMCGCVFEADKEDCTVECVDIGSFTYTTDCPECNQTITLLHEEQ